MNGDDPTRPVTKGDVDALRTDVDALRREMATKTELAALRADLADLRREMVTKADLDALRAADKADLDARDRRLNLTIADALTHAVNVAIE